MKSASRLTAPLLAAGVTASALVFAATGCGSGGGTAPAPGTLVASNSAPSFANRSYTSTIALSEGQVGNLSVTTTADGTATGTLQIVDSSRAADSSRAVKSRLVIATPFLSGTIDFATGAIHLTGSYTINGQTIPVSINGTLPTPPSYTGGSITTSIGGQTYTSTFGGMTPNPTPTPSASATASPSPSPSASATPTPSPSASATPAPTGAVNTLTVTAASGTNHNNQFSTLIAGTGVLGVTAQAFRTAAPGSGGGYLSISAKAADTKSSLSFDVTMPGTLATGTYPVQYGTGFNSFNVLITYQEYGPTRTWQSYYNGQSAGEGTITIEQLDNDKVRVRLDNVRVDPALGGFNGEKGTLRVNGVLVTTAPPFFAN